MGVRMLLFPPNPPPSSRNSFCGDNNPPPLLPVVDCLFDPGPPPVELVIFKPTPKPTLLLLLSRFELLLLTAALGGLDPEEERIEIVEIRRLSAGEGGAGRVEEREGERVRMGERGIWREDEDTDNLCCCC